MTKRRTRLYKGDCLDFLSLIDDDSIDSCVTDPPYHLTSVVKRFGKEGSAPAKHGTDGLFERASAGFMGKAWDGGDIAFRASTWAEVYRVLKPGAYLLAFSAPRNYHRMASAIEDAGFEVRDCLQWVFGSGMPKSHNQKGEWEGWGSALKPAYEPLCMARKPLDGTIAKNLEKWGTGAINIDACRIGEGTGRTSIRKYPDIRGDNYNQGHTSYKDRGTIEREVVDKGRWPANFMHDGLEDPWASFFYCAKTSKSDRGEGNAHPTVKPNELMRYLVRLVTPPNGVVLDIFMGSGSTGKAALQEGFRFFGSENEESYFEIAKKRLSEVADPVRQRSSRLEALLG